MRVLATIESYTPGFEGGGAIRSLEGLIDAIGDEVEFRVVTRDRDHGSDSPYPGVRVGAWERVGKAEVLYVPPGHAGRRALVRALREEPYDALYLNSLFATNFTLLPLLLRRMAKLPEVPTILAPRGALTPGSMAIKQARKQGFLGLARAMGLYRNLSWHAATNDEKADVLAVFPDASPIHVAVDIPAVRTDLPRTTAKVPGRLSIAFVARIGRIKNLRFALSLLRSLEGSIVFDLYGPVEDPAYWAECGEVLGTLPPNVEFRWQGAVPHERIAGIFAGADLCFVPTLGESYGHVFVEAMAAGCPVLVSDRTPWRNLERAGAGWDLPLEDPAAFVDKLQRLVAMGPEEHAQMSVCARRHAIEATRSERIVGPSRELFRSLGTASVAF